MVKMRLVRLGDKKSPVYRIVVVDARKAAEPVAGRYSFGTGCSKG